MKSILMIAILTLTSLGFMPTDVKANEQQIKVQIGRQDRDRDRDRRYRRDRREKRWNERRVRYFTRDVRYGWRVYRETYRVDNRFGRRNVTLISRVRVY